MKTNITIRKSSMTSHLSSSLGLLFGIMTVMPLGNAFASTIFNYSLDLSSGSLTQSRMANGYLTAASSNSVTLVGSDGAYYPGTTTTLSFGNAFDQANTYVGNNDAGLAGITYVGMAQITSSTPIRYVSTDPYAFTQDPAFYSYLNNLGISNADLLNQLNSNQGFQILIPYYQVSYSYNYAWTDTDTPGYDYAQGMQLPAVSVPVQNSTSSLSNNATGNVQVSLRPYEPSFAINPLWYTGNPVSGAAWDVHSLDNVGGPGSLTIQNFQISVTPMQYSLLVVPIVPEPRTYSMLLAGLAMVYVATRRRKTIQMRRI